MTGVNFGRFPCYLAAGIVCIVSGCFTHRDVMPGRPFPIAHVTGEDCKADKAQVCYEKGLTLAAAGSSIADRTRGISLLRQACAAKVSAACDNLARRFKPPQKLSGKAPRYTTEAAWDGVIGRITVRCLLTIEGIPTNCAIVAPRTEKEREILETSGQGAEMVKTVSTWRFTAAQFDGEPCETEFLVRTELALR